MLESKRRAIIFITISLLLAVIAGFMFLMKVNELNDSLGGTTKVYVASKSIDTRKAITPEDIEIIDLPNKFVAEDYIKVGEEAEKITNKVTVVPLIEDTIITESVLKDFSNIGDPNKRVVLLRWSEKLFPDDKIIEQERVDIIVSHQFDGAPKTETFMTDVLVLGEYIPGKKQEGIYVEVSKENAPKLIHMQNYADSIRLLKADVGQEEPKKEAPKEEKPEQKPAAQPEKPQEKPAPQPQQQTPSQPSQ